MKSRLKKAMMVVLIIQFILFGIAIFGGNTIQSLSDEYLNTLENGVLLRKNYIQDEMLQYWSNLTDFENNLQKEVNEMGILDDLSLIPQFLDKVVNRTIFTLRQSGVTEIFIILEGEKDEASDFYYKPFQAAESYPNIPTKDLGYWSRPFSLSSEDIEIVTYSLPLVDEEGKPYGVLGVGLTVDYLSGKLNYDELIENKRGAYLLGIRDADKTSIEKIVSSGPMYNILAGSQTTSHEKKEQASIYKVKDKGTIDGDVYASEQYINLYNTNTPFENDKWTLTGFVEGKDLFRPIEKIIYSIIFSLFISLILGIIVVYVVGTWFMKPINKLMKSVVETDIPNIYRYKKDDGKTCWVQLIIEEKKGKKLGVIEDVTDEKLLKRKI